MARLGAAYDTVQDAVGADAPDEVYLDAPDWSDVTAVAVRLAGSGDGAQRPPCPDQSMTRAITGLGDTPATDNRRSSPAPSAARRTTAHTRAHTARWTPA